MPPVTTTRVLEGTKTCFPAKSVPEGIKLLTAVLDSSGWFHTGDRGELDPQGNLYFKGRTKDVIVTPEGMKVYPEDLEAVLRRAPQVRDCVVLGYPVGANAEPCAVLIMRDGEGEAEAAVRRANKSLAEFQQVRRWAVWPGDDFPRTSTQKPRRALILDAVRARIGAGNAPPASGEAPAAGTLMELVEHITGRKVPPLRPDASLATDLNLSSMDRVELLSELEDRLQTDLNETRFAAATTVGELEEMLRAPAERLRLSALGRALARAVDSLGGLLPALLAGHLVAGIPGGPGQRKFKGAAWSCTRCVEPCHER